MSRFPFAVLAGLLVAAPLAGQTGREHFVQPDTAIDAVHAAQQDAFLLLRDSTSRISSAGARLMSEMSPSASLAWMRARATAVSKACAGAVAPLASARAVTTGATWPRENQRKAQADLVKGMTSFADDLAGCQKQWTQFTADTSQQAMREKAPYEMKKLQDKLDEFNRTAGTYLRFINVKLPPTSSSKP